MSDLSLIARAQSAPVIADARKAKARLADLLSQADGAGLAEIIGQNPLAEKLLLALADHSPFLWRLAMRDPARVFGLLSSDPDARLRAIVAGTRAAGQAGLDEAELKSALRLARQEISLLVALADCAGVWSVEAVTAALSDFADAAVNAAIDHLLRELAAAGRFAPADLSDPARGCGLVVLALGKHGAGELNYSSDVDLVVFFDPDAARLADGLEPNTVYVRLVKAMARILQDMTGDGHVLRVDLRLRPDPGSTSTVVSLPAAFTYYETVGQNWERAAFIKARAIAGDIAAGEVFLADLAPFIWRKYFDFGAIADIHAMKRQIHAVKGHDRIAVAGHDIKLGRGGIREVEFFVQTQQLVFGGRRPRLRGRRTLEMLAELCAEKWIGADARDELALAYRFLRMVEHRLQMVADEQTQRLPADKATLARFAQFCGFPDLKRFSAALTGHAARVEAHYALLFEEGLSLASESGSLVFTGKSDDPETLATLARLGFRDGPLVCETVRGWHFGRRPAVTTARAREVLTELVPALLAAFGKTSDPDAAIAAFDRSMLKMSAAVELMTLLKSNEALLRLFAEVLGSAPRLAEIAAQRPHVLDAMIDPAFTDPSSDDAAISTRIAAAIGAPEHFEDFLDRARDVGRQEAFVAGARLLSNVYAPAQYGQAASAIAAALIEASLAAVRREFTSEHGVAPGARLAVFGLGKLGGRELTATSDLDLMIVYDFDEARSESDGRRGLHAVHYHTRLAQRLVTAITAPTRRGTLYEVDLRLRPTGSKAAAAVQFSGIAGYYASEAETWEKMALTRGRFVAGDASLGAELTALLSDIIAAPRDKARLAADILDMRRLIAREKGEDDAADLKLASGGLVDCEFLAQFAVLAHAHVERALIAPATEVMLAGAVERGLLGPDGAYVLQAFRLLRDVQHWQRLAVAGRFDPADVSAAVRCRIANGVGLPDWRVLEAHLAETRGRVRALFEDILGRAKRG